MGLIKKYNYRTGKVPSSFYYTGNKLEKVKIEIISYDSDKLIRETFEFEDFETLEGKIIKEKEKGVLWINVYGLSNIELMRFLGEKLEISNIHIGDILDIGQRPKIDANEDFTFILMNMLKRNASVMYEQISIFSKGNTIITFQEIIGDVFNPIRERLEKKEGIVRDKNKDYLLYLLIDLILDNYFKYMTEMDDSIEKLEEDAMEKDTDEILKEIYVYKKELAKLRSSVSPLKDILKALRDNADDENKRYYNYLFDHIFQMTENTNVLREMINGIYEIYISNLSNKMNKIMTILTIFSAIFIPLTFITGVYGMNFVHMPGLGYQHSFFIFWIVCIVIFLSMIVYFKNKRWL